MATALRRYDFYTIFDYDPTNGVLLPKYDVRIPSVNAAYREGIGITHSSVVGLNLFDHIGSAFVGRWDKKRKELEVVGLC